MHTEQGTTNHLITYCLGCEYIRPRFFDWHRLTVEEFSMLARFVLSSSVILGSFGPGLDVLPDSVCS